MNKSFVVYVDMDGVLNLFETDPNARKNMWKPGYFINIPVREGISEVLEQINKTTPVVVLSKVIERSGVKTEKNIWLKKNISSNAYSSVIYVPHKHSKADYLLPDFDKAMLVDDSEFNLIECHEKGCHGLFLSDTRKSEIFENAKTPEDIWEFYKKLAP